jgi:hypothetical protein
VRIRRTAAGRLMRVVAAGAVASAGLAGTLATGTAASASPATGTAPAWRTQAVRAPAGMIGYSLDGVSCSSSSACLAIGTSGFKHNDNLGEFAETWNGSRWTPRTVPNGTGAAFLEAVQCRSARWCVAVGGVENNPVTATDAPVADLWNGKTFRQVRLPLPAGTNNGVLASVACSGPAACTAVGQVAENGGTARLVAERWNGSSWKVQLLPEPSGGTLLGVACPAVHACRAVGYDVAGPLTEFWNGSSWRVQAASRPADAADESLIALSCRAAGSCQAVGTYESTSNLDWYSLAEAWNGTRWRVQATPAVSGATSAMLSGVSCLSAADCEAGGQVMTKGDSVSFGVVEKWNGAQWSLQEQLPAQGNTKPSNVEGVSCTAGPVCEAVGFHGSGLLAQRYSR